jgi:uncharacterized protein YfaS (alpha-2-macroglobulin family)
MPVGEGRMKSQLKLFVIICIALMLISCEKQPVENNQPQENTLNSAVSVETEPAEETEVVSEENDEIRTLDEILAGEEVIYPVVLSAIPIDSETLKSDSDFVVTFSQSMDVASVEESLTLVNENEEIMPGAFEWNEGATEVTFIPNEFLAPGGRYELSVSEKAKSADGVSLDKRLLKVYYMKARLKVMDVFPKNDSQDVLTSSQITVLFSQPVVPLAIHEERDELLQPIIFDPPVEGTGKWVNTSLYVFTPDTPLTGSTRYALHISESLAPYGQEESLALGEEYVWQFNTMTPRLLESWFGGCWFSDGENECDYPIGLSPRIKLEFSQEMNLTSMPNTVHIYDANGNSVPLQFSKGEDVRQVLIQPRTQLKIGKVNYTFVIDANTESLDGGTLANDITLNFFTEEVPQVVSVNQYETFGMILSFNHEIDPASIKSHVVIDPPIDSNYVVSRYYGYSYTSNEYVIGGFAPSTTYEITILPGIKDIYGYATQEKFTETLKFGDMSAYIDWEGYGKQYRIGTPIDMFLTFRNVSELGFKIYKIPVEDYMEAMDYSSGYSPRETLVWEGSYAVEQELNKTYTRRINLEELVGESLELGTYYAVITGKKESNARYNNVRFEQEFAVVSANMTMKTSDINNLVWVTDQATGEPSAGVEVVVYDELFKAKYSYTTDDQGIAYFDIPPDTDDRYGHGYYLVAQSEDCFAISDDSAYYSYGDYDSSYVGTIYSDREIYRPGDTIYFKGILRRNGDEGLEDPVGLVDEVTVKVIHYDGGILFKEVVEVSGFGTFNGEFVIDEDTNLGNYTLVIDAYTSSFGIESDSFRIADYRKPEYFVDYDFGGEIAYIGDPLDIKVTGKYYSGGTLSNASIIYNFDIGANVFSPPTQYSSYSFSNDLMNSSEDDYMWLYNTATLDGEGSYTIHIPESVLEKLDNRQLVGTLAVVDESSVLVSSSIEIPVLSGKMFAGIKAQSYLGSKGDKSLFDVLLLDYEGNPVPDYPFEVEIFRVSYTESYYTDSYNDDYVYWHYKPVLTSVKKITGLVSDEDAKATVPFTPTEGGSYYVVASARDAQGYKTQSGTGFWVSNWRYGSIMSRGNREIEVVPDKDSYLPGETANILVETPYQGTVYALVTLETDEIKEANVVQIDSADPILKLPITYDLFTRVYYDVTLVKGADDLTPIPGYQHGGAFINVSTLEKELFLEVTSQQPYVTPGDEVTYDLVVRDSDGNPVEAELSLALVDKAVVALTGQKFYNFINVLYPLTSHRLSTAYSMRNSIEAANAALSETVSYWTPWDGTFPPGDRGGGGDDYVPYDSNAIRDHFEDTAYWQAELLTDENGKASVTIAIPDNLTTWQLTAVAFTKDAKVGYERTEIVSNKPLMIAPQTPRFFVVGDESTVRANVFNNTSEEMEIVVSMKVEGAELLSEMKQTISLEAGKQEYVTWDVYVQLDSERVDMVFTAVSEAYSDASRPTLATLDGQGLPVYRYEVLETVSTSGALNEGGLRTELIQLPQSMDVSQASLDITIEPSLLVGMKDGLSYLQHYPYECNEQLISKFLPNIITYQALEDTGLADTSLESNLDATVNYALPRLYLSQLNSGGWGWWAKSDESNSLISAYVMYGLWHAQQAGYDVDEKVINRGKVFLTKQITKQSTEEYASNTYQLNRLTFLVYVYAHYEDEAEASAMELYEYWPLMSLESRAYLAYALDVLGGHDDEVTTLLNSLVDDVILSASGAHWEEISNDRWNWNTDTRSTAVILDTMIRLEPENPITANAVRWLMRNREDGHWASTQETAWTLLSLSDWMKVSGDLAADYEYAVNFNGKEIGTGQANQDTLEEIQTMQVDIASFMQGELNRLTMARSDGEGNLYYTVDYTANLPVKDINALDAGVLISREYFAEDDLETPVTEANQGDLLVAKITIVLPATSHYLLVEDMLPAGMEAVDTALETSQEYYGKLGLYSKKYDWWWYFNHSELRDEKVVLTAEYLPPGTYTYTYLVQASFPGTYNVIPTVAQEFYFPDVYGRGDGSQFVILP